jgi:hypothetical protein
MVFSRLPYEKGPVMCGFAQALGRLGGGPAGVRQQRDACLNWGATHRGAGLATRDTQERRRAGERPHKSTLSNFFCRTGTQEPPGLGRRASSRSS